jgi:hypothetical protein
LLILRTVWATPADRTRGRRVIRTATVASEGLLLRALAELVPTMILDTRAKRPSAPAGARA